MITKTNSGNIKFSGFHESTDTDGWTTRGVIDPGTGAIDRNYYYKRRKAPKIRLKGKLAQQAAGYALIANDLEHVERWLEEIERSFPTSTRPTVAQFGEKSRESLLVQGLTVAGLTFYAKCFTQCDGRKTQMLRKHLDIEYRALHDQIMKRRHNFAAHSGAQRFEDVYIDLVLPPQKRSEKPVHLRAILRQMCFWLDVEKEIGFHDLVTHVREVAEGKKEKLFIKIVNEVVVPKGRLYWYKRARV